MSLIAAPPGKKRRRTCCSSSRHARRRGEVSSFRSLSASEHSPTINQGEDKAACQCEETERSDQRNRARGLRQLLDLLHSGCGDWFVRRFDMSLRLRRGGLNCRLWRRHRNREDRDSRCQRHFSETLHLELAHIVRIPELPELAV